MTKQNQTNQINVLIGCECSGRIREAFRRLGYNAWSCDLKRASDMSEFHYQGDIFKFINEKPKGYWDLGIFHPPCTYIASSGRAWDNHWQFPERKESAKKAIEFALKLWQLPLKHIAIENPVGRLSSEIGKATQIIQPYQFGDEAQKTTCLWLKNLPLLVPTKEVGKGEIITLSSGRKMPKWFNEAKSGANDYSGIRSKTFKGIADAIGEQWGRYVSDTKNGCNLFSILIGV